jgi:hypothetical protein
MSVEKTLLQTFALEMGIELRMSVDKEEIKEGGGEGRRATIRALEEHSIDREELRGIGRDIGPTILASAEKVCNAMIDVWGDEESGEGEVEKVVEAAKMFLDYVMKYEEDIGEDDSNVGKSTAALVEVVYEHAKGMI